MEGALQRTVQPHSWGHSYARGMWAPGWWTGLSSASLSLACGPEPWLKESGSHTAWAQVPPRVFLKNLTKGGWAGSLGSGSRCGQISPWDPQAFRPSTVLLHVERCRQLEQAARWRWWGAPCQPSSQGWAERSPGHGLGGKENAGLGLQAWEPAKASTSEAPATVAFY